MYSTDTNTPRSEINQRLDKLKKQLEENSIGAALIVQRADLFYFSGTIQEAHLYVPVDDEPILMVFKSLERAIAESSLSRIVPLKSPKAVPEILRQSGYSLPQSIGLELDVLPTNLYFNYQRLFEGKNLVDISHLIRRVRAIKSPYEIEMMRRAARLSDQVAARVPELLCEGITELELAGQVEAEARKLGHQGIVRMRLWGSEMFYGHLLAGPSGAVPSFLSSPTGGSGASPAVAQGPGFRPIQRHEPVLVDYVFALNGYYSDHTRIFSLGKPDEELMAAHTAMLDVQNLIKKAAKPGVKSGDIYDLALIRATELGYDKNFMGVGKERIRFVGHGVGVELDEYPFLAAGQNLELQENMTLALEPKLIFPGKGVVGIENTHVVTAKGLDQLG
ncbi:MAG: aminopeptidase P family protein, partial [Desulfobacterales bacterium]|nr:aminopeptidase P family protein [Desulfobacterales bacterium]